MTTAQIALPTHVRPDEIAREKTLGHAIELCAKVAGFDLDKELQQALGVDKAQFSRWLSGHEGIMWPKLERIMDACGNDAPLLWMLYQRGYDLHSLHKRESEIERALRLEREERERLTHENELLRSLIHAR